MWRFGQMESLQQFASVHANSKESAAPKCSGIGRELGPEGLEAYPDPKTINLPMGYQPGPRAE